MAQLNRFATLFLIFVGVIAITSVAAAKAPPEAKKHLDAGLAYIDDPTGPRYEDAYHEFLTAYEIYPAFELLANIGTCALYLERDAEAIDAYERYLVKASTKDIPTKKRTLMEKDVQTLKASLVQLSIDVTPSAVTLIDERFTSKGQSVVNRYDVTDGKTALGIHPGTHRITAHREGFEDQRWEIDAKPASSHAHRFQLVVQNAGASTPTPPFKQQSLETGSNVTKQLQPSRPTPTSVYVGLGVTGVFAVAAAVGGVLTVSKRSDYVDANDGKHVDDAATLRDDAARYRIASGIAGGAAVIAGAVTTYLYVTRPYQTNATQDKQSRWRVVTVVGTNRAGVSLSGEF